jgi:hypothetical protein
MGCTRICDINGEDKKCIQNSERAVLAVLPL